MAYNMQELIRWQVNNLHMHNEADLCFHVSNAIVNMKAKVSLIPRSLSSSHNGLGVI